MFFLGATDSGVLRRARHSDRRHEFRLNLERGPAPGCNNGQHQIKSNFRDLIQIHEDLGRKTNLYMPATLFLVLPPSAGGRVELPSALVGRHELTTTNTPIRLKPVLRYMDIVPEYSRADLRGSVQDFHLSPCAGVSRHAAGSPDS